MKKWYHILILILIIINVFLFFKILLSQGNIQLFNPQGMIALQQRDLLITYVLIMLVIVIPVFIVTYFIAWKYRSSNAKAHFTPEAKYSKFSEGLLWVFPTIIVIIMSVITWEATHRIDPHKPITSDVKPLTIQVVALQWKWLFIYPEQGIATVNYIAFPEDTPLIFTLTADGPMSSFWIPQLGGQLYAMTGMSQSLHLIADNQGEFRGSNAEISGAGFATMKFTAKSTSQREFERWVDQVRQSPHKLTLEEYNKLATPSENTLPLFYNSTEPDLFTTIMMKFMMPPKPTGEFHIMENGEMMEGKS
ncbi:MAG TPA: ubiquinol oxidase subunit II, partial [Patescibacteria group bacterium]|nr:ubiquinol oxidase subunit II [Patescibacteria group bacterium]